MFRIKIMVLGLMILQADRYLYGSIHVSSELLFVYTGYMLCF